MYLERLNLHRNKKMKTADLYKKCLRLRETALYPDQKDRNYLHLQGLCK